MATKHCMDIPGIIVKSPLVHQIVVHKQLHHYIQQVKFPHSKLKKTRWFPIPFKSHFFLPKDRDILRSFQLESLILWKFFDCFFALWSSTSFWKNLFCQVLFINFSPWRIYKPSKFSETSPPKKNLGHMSCVEKSSPKPLCSCLSTVLFLHHLHHQCFIVFLKRDHQTWAIYIRFTKLSWPGTWNKRNPQKT